MKWDLEYVCLSDIGRYRKNNQDKSYPMAYTFYYQKSGGKWLLYDMMSIDIDS